MSDIKISRTQKALRLIQGEGITAKEAAERVGITSAAVSKGKHHPSKTQQKIRMFSEMQEEIESLRQQLAISEAKSLEQARLLKMSGEREAALLAALESAVETIEWMHGCTAPADDEVEKAIREGNAAITSVKGGAGGVSPGAMG